jgi:sigma-B regulation protein RsbU (phosphoserine phosphatase)
MLVFSRIHVPGMKRAIRRFKLWQRCLTIARSILVLELALEGAALLYFFKGSGVAGLEIVRRYPGYVTILAVVATCALLHLVITRRIVRAVERRFSPAEYDEHRILFDFGQEALAATSLDQLYGSIVSKIKGALDCENLSIFVRDDATGDFVCRISSPDLQCASGVEGGATGTSKAALSGRAFVIKRLHHLTTPLVIEPGEFETWTRAFDTALRQVRESRELELRTLQAIKATLLLPIKIREQLVGIVSLGPRRAQHKYSPKDKEMLMSMAGQLAFVIENSKLAERMVIEENMRRELALAAEVQQGLLPSAPPYSAYVELAGFCLPARGVGGDYYDFISFGSEQVGVAVADVSGKGISAALVMSNVQAALRSQTMLSQSNGLQVGSLGELVSNINKLVCRSTASGTYVTFFYAQYDQRSHQLSYVNAGHNPPLLIRGGSQKRASSRSVQSLADHFEPAYGLFPFTMNGESWSRGDYGRVEERSIAAHRRAQPMNGASDCVKLTTGGPVIGLFDQSMYEQGVVELERGDLLIAYTDGVTESLNILDEEFGEENLQRVASLSADLSADKVRDRIVESVKLWATGTPQHDDLTFIVLKVK